MRLLLVAAKSLRELLREWQLLLLVVALPLAFLAITAAGYSAPLLATHPIAVLDPGGRAAALVEDLKARRYADGRSVFEIVPDTDRAAAEVALAEQQIAALVIVATDATDAGADGLGRIVLKGDALYLNFFRASALLEEAVYRYADRLADRPQVVGLIEEPLGVASPQSEFDLYAPGMMIFALLLIVPQTAMLVARELRWGTLRRLRLTSLRAWELLGGISLSQMVVAVAQVLVIFASALLLGFHNQGSLALAIVVGLAVSFSAIGLGLIVACFVEDDSQAINVGSAVAMLQVFLSGAFYRFPTPTVFSLAGHQIDLFDVFPATHGFLALQQILSYGYGWRDVAFRLGATLVLSLLYFWVGVVIFQRLKMGEQQ